VRGWAAATPRGPAHLPLLRHRRERDEGDVLDGSQRDAGPRGARTRTILNQQDCIVKITSTAICGSDLHLYNGFLPMMEPGDIMGHEFMGEVVEVGGT
jgi:threonine dehydrogenase-like Zn-dependent dehydrogenase